jgi:hypothetical protein
LRQAPLLPLFPCLLASLTPLALGDDGQVLLALQALTRLLTGSSHVSLAALVCLHLEVVSLHPSVQF